MVSNHETSFFRDLEVYQIIKDMNLKIFENRSATWPRYFLNFISEQENFKIYASDISNLQL